MLAVEKWAKDKNPLLAFFATQFVANTREAHLEFQQIRERRLSNHQFPLPSPTPWFAMYRSHRKLINFLKKIILKSSMYSKETYEYGEALINELTAIGSGKVIKSEHPPSAEEIEKAKNFLQNLLSESFQALKTDFDDTPLASEVKKDLNETMSEMDLEGSFLVLVWAPCSFLYRTHPTRLYRKARQGDIDAIEKLLLIDPLMLNEPAIARHIHSLRLNNKQNEYESLLVAPIKPLDSKIKPKRMKGNVAGLILALARMLNIPLKENEIRDLFHAVAKDLERDEDVIDFDLSDDQGFFKTTKRNSTSWLKMLDKTK